MASLTGLVFILIVVGIGFLGVALPIYALVRLSRVPAENLSLSPVVWAFIIICFPIVGSLAFFFAGDRR